MAAYTNHLRIGNGLDLDFTVAAADTASDGFLGVSSAGQVTKFTSVPASRVSAGAALTEVTSSVLTLSAGLATALLTAGTIQVKLATTSQSGYLSSTDWNTFNGKLSTTLLNGQIFVGNGSNIATGVAVTGDIAITNAGVTSITAGVIVNADINGSAAILHNKMAALSASLVMATDGSGFATTIAGFTTVIGGYMINLTSDVQAQLNSKLTATITSPLTGQVISYNGTAWVNTSGASNGLPVGGTTGQYLNKINGTDYNAQWSTLTVSSVTDLTASAAELNLLDGVTATTVQLNYLNTATGNIQSALNSKQSSTLGQHSIWVGNSVNVAQALAVGSEGQIFTVSGGTPTWTTLSTGVSSVSGTLNRITSTGGATPIIDIASTYVGQTSIVTLGTIGTGVWQGTPVGVVYGGTGFSSYAVGDLLQANTTTTLSKLAGVATGNALISGGVGVVSSWGKIGLTTHVSGILPVANGGTALSTIAAKSIWVANATDVVTTVTPGALRSIRMNAGNTAWEAYNPSEIVAGSNTQVQFNDSGVMGAEAAFVYDKTTNQLSIGVTEVGSVNVGFITIKGNLASTGTSIFIGNSPGGGTGARGVAIGNQTLQSLTTGNENIAIGYIALGAITTGFGNIGIGFQAGDNLTTTATRNIIIGYDIDMPVATGNNQLAIQNIIFGINNSATGTAVSTGFIGIGTPSPDRRFHAELDTDGLGVDFVARLTKTRIATTGFAANSGLGLEFEMETSHGVNVVGTTIKSVATNVGAGTEAFDAVIATMSAGVLADRVTIDNSGNVGIGTTSPNTELQISRAGATVGLRLSADAAQQAEIAFEKGGTNKWFLRSTASSNDLDFFSTTANAATVTFQGGGNVGIGTATFDSGVGVLGLKNATTAPAAGDPDMFIQYSADIAAGRAAPHFMTEDGHVIKLFRGSAVADATGGAVIDAEARAALNALLARLRVTGGSGQIAD